MENIHKIIGGNIRRLREERNVQQNVLAKELGMDGSYLTKIEKGERKLNLERILKAKDILDTDINEILVGTGYEDSKIEIKAIEEDLLKLNPVFLCRAKEIIHSLLLLQNDVLDASSDSKSNDENNN